MANNTTESRKQQKQKINPIALIVILIATTLAGLAFAYAGTMTVITCQRTQQVNCEIKESLLGLYPVSEQQVANVQSVRYDSETRTSTSTTRSGSGSGSSGKKKKKRSRTTTKTTTKTTTYYKLVLVGGNGASVKTSENTSSSWTNQTTTRLNNFLDNSTDKRISARYIRWAPMAASSFFLILPFLGIISSLFGFIISVAGGKENQKGNKPIHSKT